MCTSEEIDRIGRVFYVEYEQKFLFMKFRLFSKKGRRNFVK